MGMGWLLLGVSEKVPIESCVPMIMFAIVFGLSMDYEVFLLTRVREAWNRTGDNHASVAGGLAATARVITLLVVPATMFLLGKANWWTPRWLRRFPELLEPVETPKTAVITTPASAGAVHDPPAVRHGRPINATLNDVHRSHAGTLLDALDTRRHGGVPQSLSRR
jgi:putative drug exporter of the RND superfamily